MKIEELQNIFEILLNNESGSDTHPFEIGAQAFVGYCVKNHHHSHAQLFQDLYVLLRLGEKRNGFFVEFGACDGVTLSNTFVLEKKLGWNGVLSEPWHGWHDRLKVQRSCKIETRCVWNVSGEIVKFSGIPKHPELSTVTELVTDDFNAKDRADGQEEVEVETISINDLLSSSSAPKEFDYLSIDTEGSELRILNSMDFSRWKPKIITVEHNFTNQREGIHALLTAQGYGRELEPFSKWDDWYFRSG